ncbi:MAG: metallophosphoesterase [Planctomycetaceae bacterium]|nr:metallophosphoesterase [Planctomycetaceae bacterium]
MSQDWVFLALFAVGQAGVLAVSVNVTHALGFRGRIMDWIKVLLLALTLVMTAVIAREASRKPWSTWPWPASAYALACLAIALVGLPATTLARSFRRQPPGISVRDAEIDLAQRHGTEVLIGRGKRAWMLRLPGNEAFRLRKRDWDVVLPSLPIAWDGLSLLQISDLHFSPAYSRRFFELMLDEAATVEADLVLFTGDLIDHDAAIEWIVPLLSRIEGRLGSYAILGNHDYDHDHLRTRQALVEAGFTDLEGRWATLAIEGLTLALGGTSAPWGPRLDPGLMPDADFRLVLSHSPDLLPKAARWGIDLMLSGHNHGGQVRLPVIGPVFMPSRYSRRFDRDFFRIGPTLLHVSQGVAAKDPIRYGCVPEISRLTLRSACLRQGSVHEGDLATERS